MRVALYPGSFDPVTNGHLDVLQRALAVFDRVVVAVLANPRKSPLLPVETRVVVLETAIRDAGIDVDHASVTTFDGLTVEAARANGARWLVRGLRAISDFEAEGQLAANNRAIAEDIDTVFFMTAVEFGYVSSSLVKEIASFGGDVSSMVPAAALTALRTQVRQRDGAK
ncbi:MAG TPA: pantetheine-phosphate adenylyltransferase [Candidatus Limnocylindrales bacterium]|nr:pantetheine-phosphate adenylyltransferase [Candidatus Limnocylindrales bacterium]